MYQANITPYDKDYAAYHSLSRNIPKPHTSQKSQNIEPTKIKSFTNKNRRCHVWSSHIKDKLNTLSLRHPFSILIDDVEKKPNLQCLKYHGNKTRKMVGLNFTHILPERDMDHRQSLGRSKHPCQRKKKRHTSCSVMLMSNSDSRKCSRMYFGAMSPSAWIECNQNSWEKKETRKASNRRLH